MEPDYKRTAKKDANKSMAITVQGHEVALIFADAPNPQVVAQVRQALLSAYFPAKR